MLFLLSVCLVGKARPVSFRLLRLNRSAEGHGPDNDEDVEEDEGDYGRDVSLCWLGRVVVLELGKDGSCATHSASASAPS